MDNIYGDSNMVMSWMNDETVVEKYIREAVYFNAGPYSVIDDLYMRYMESVFDYR